MSKKIYLNLLILCGILSQVIVGTFLDDNDKNLLNLHSRKKRLVDNTISGSKKYRIEDVPYIVKVLKNGEQICAGIIVSPAHILTILQCVQESEAMYSVESGDLSTNTLQIHHIECKIFQTNLVLLLIRPYLLQNPSLNRNILLYKEATGTRTITTISGWETKSQSGNKIPSLRRSMNVPVSSWKACFDYYKKHHFKLTKDNICTLEPSKQKSCTGEDVGSALVLNGELVGVLLLPGKITGQFAPDVFIRVNNNNTHYKWIMSHIGPYVQKEEYTPLLHNNYIQVYPRPQLPYNQYSHPPTSHFQNQRNPYSNLHTSH